MHKRRTFLRLAGGSTALAATGITSAASKHETLTDPTQMIECGIEATLPEPSRQGAYRVAQWDIPARYQVDATEQRLYALRPIRDPELASLQSSNAVARFRSLRPASRVLFDTPVSRIPLTAGHNFQQNRELELAEEHSLPTVTVNDPQNDGTVVVRLRGSDWSIAPGDETEISLGEQNVTVELSRLTDELHENPAVPDHLLGQKREYWTETVTLEPTIRVRNRGPLDVYDATSQEIVN